MSKSIINALIVAVALSACNGGGGPTSGTIGSDGTPADGTGGAPQTTELALLAGSIGGSGLVDASGTAARFNMPSGLAADAAGYLYVADTANGAIRKIAPGGDVSTLAGSAGRQGSADGIGAAAQFDHPGAVAADAEGNVFVADTANHTIRKISPAGEVTTLAGLADQRGSTDGVGHAARFAYPNGIAVDAGGSVYVADTLNHTIRKINPGGLVSTVAGVPDNPGSADGTGPSARFNSPTDVAVAADGTLLVADSGNCAIRKVSATGVVSTFAGMGGICGSDDGSGSAARFASPRGVALDAQGNLYVTDGTRTEPDGFGYPTVVVVGNNIRKITPAGTVSTLTAAGTGVADETAPFANPSGITVGPSGKVYVADTLTHVIREVGPGGDVTTIAGMAGYVGSRDGSGADARFLSPTGVATDAANNVYVSDPGASTIRRIAPSGMVTTLAGTASSPGSSNGTGPQARFYNPRGLAVDSQGNVIVADAFNNAIRKITPAGVVTTLAGVIGTSGSADGPAAQATFFLPTGVAIDAADNVYVSDYGNDNIRKITASGEVSTLAGSAGNAGSADGMGRAATFNNPEALAVDASGNLFVADNHTVRKIAPSGLVSTVAGLAGTPSNVDGVGADARFYHPNGVAVGADGNLYVSDMDNYSIRKITPDGTVSTYIGVAGSRGIKLGPLPGSLERPFGLAVGGAGLVITAGYAVLVTRQ